MLILGYEGLIHRVFHVFTACAHSKARVVVHGPYMTAVVPRYRWFCCHCGRRSRRVFQDGK